MNKTNMLMAVRDALGGHTLQFGAYFTPPQPAGYAANIAATLRAVPVGTILHTADSVWVHGTTEWKVIDGAMSAHGSTT